MGEHLDNNLNCVICHAAACDWNETDEVGEEIRRGLRLFCKLLKVTTPPGTKYVELIKVISSGGISSLPGGGDEEGEGVVAACKFCSTAFQEIVRLDQTIENLKKSQLVHVDSLKKSLVRAGRSGSKDPLSSNFWEQATTQLFNCLNGGKPPTPARKRTVNYSHDSLDDTCTPPPPKRCRPLILQKPKKSISSKVPLKPNPAPTKKLESGLKRCSVRITRLQAKKRESFEDDGDTSHYESSDFIKKEYEEDVGEEPEDVMEDPEDVVEDPEEEEEVTSKTDLVVPVSDHTPSSTKYRKSRWDSLIKFQENMYAYRSTIIKYSHDNRHHICQESDCFFQFTGSFVDGTFYDNIRRHVMEDHNEIRGRPCALCLQKCATASKLRTHFVREHSTVGRTVVVSGKKKSRALMICLTCGKPCLDSDHLVHTWSHRNVKEQVAAIQAGELVPFKILKNARERKNHPLHSHLYGGGDTLEPPKKDFSELAKRVVGVKSGVTYGNRSCSRQSKSNAPQTKKNVKGRDQDRMNDSDPDFVPSDGNTKTERVDEDADSDDWTPRKKPHSPKKSCNPSTPHGVVNRMLFLQEHWYMFKHTLIKFCLSQRHFICQEPDCRVFFWGSVQDGSVFENIRNHVVMCHGVADAKVRSCPLCSKKIKGAPMLRKHFITTHSKTADYATPKAMVICLFCGKPCYDSDHFKHIWTHKSFDEQVASIKEGQLVPSSFLKMVRGNVNHVLYPVLFEQGKSTSSGGRDSGSADAINFTKLVTALNQEPLGKIHRRVYCQPEENILLYKDVVFRSKGRVYQCLEAGCSFTVPDWVNGALTSLQKHCHREHQDCGGRQGQAVRKDVQKTCPLCKEKVEGAAQFRAHLAKDHLQDAIVLCEVCSKPLDLEEDYLTHLGTHQPEDGLTAAKPRKHSPFSWNTNVKKPNSPACQTTAPPRRLKLPQVSAVSRYLLYVNKSTVLYLGTLISIQDHGSKLLCQGPECGQTFVGGPMNFWEAFSQVKGHIEQSHMQHFHSRTHSVECPVCMSTFYGGLQLRKHIVKEHKGSCGHQGYGPNIGKPLGCSWTICEVCLKPVKNTHTHIHGHSWTHMNDQEQCADAVRASHKDGERPPDENLDMELLRKIRMSQLDLVAISCHLCGMVFARRTYLTVHLKTHETERKTWSCSYCGKKFLAPVAVRKHVENFHRPDLRKTRKCTVPGCERLFNIRDTYKFQEHMRKHRGETPWICDMCGKGFYSKGLWKSHQSTVHAESEEKWQCAKCGKYYRNKNSLDRHNRKYH